MCLLHSQFYISQQFTKQNVQKVGKNENLKYQYFPAMLIFSDQCNYKCCNLEWIDIQDISGICLDTGIGDIDNLKIPIFLYFAA
jgi:hypothetical protein